MFANRIQLGLTLCLLLPFAAICQTEGTWLQTNSLLYDLSQKAATGNISELCKTQLSALQQAALTQATWAMKVLDASVAPTAGFIFGQNYWFGDRKTCEITTQLGDLKLSQPDPITDELAPYPLDYRVFYVNHQSRWQFSIGIKKPQLLHIGLCVPRACGAFELEHLLQAYLAERPPAVFKHYGMRTELIYSKTLKLSKDFFESESLKWLSVLLAFTAAMTMLAHMFVNKALPPEMRNKWQQLLSCYDLNDNWQRLQPRTDSQDIKFFSGLRCLTAYIIIVVHSIYYMYATVDNSITSQEAITALTTRHSYLAGTVEIFFTTSGFLFAASVLSNPELVKTIRDGNFVKNFGTFVKMIMGRYLRLAPLQFSVMLVAALSHAYFRDTSIFHVYDPLDEYCAKNWWHNLLFIQNLYPHEEMCGNWTWTTACDMQFFFVSTLAFFVYTKHPNFIKRLTLVALLSNIICTFVLLYNNNLSLRVDAVYQILGLFYTKPHIRILSYLIGCIYGNFHIKKVKTALSISGSFLNIFIAFVVFGFALSLSYEPGQLAACLIFIIGRLLISVGVGSFILTTLNAPKSNERGFLLRLLDSRIFQYISPLSYAIYMLNPVIIMGFSYALNDTLKFNTGLMVLLFFGFATVTTFAAVVFTLFFELPYVKFTKMLFARQQKTSTK